MSREQKLVDIIFEQVGLWQGAISKRAVREMREAVVQRLQRDGFPVDLDAISQRWMLTSPDLIDESLKMFEHMKNEGALRLPFGGFEELVAKLKEAVKE